MKLNNLIGDKSISLLKYIKTKKITTDEYKSFYDTIDKKTMSYLQFYKYAGYIPINTYLRDPYDEKAHSFSIAPYTNIPNALNSAYKKQFKAINGDTKLSELWKLINTFYYTPLFGAIKSIDSLFKKPDVPKIKPGITLYRGSIFPDIKSYKQGSTIKFNEYLSTSFNPRISVNFSGNYSDDRVLFVINKSQGIPYIFLDWSAVESGDLHGLKVASGDEYEYLLPRNLEFKITSTGYTSKYNKYMSIFNQIEAFKAIAKTDSIDSIDSDILARDDVINAMKLYVVELEPVRKWTPDSIKPIKFVNNSTMTLIMNINGLSKLKKKSESPEKATN